MHLFRHALREPLDRKLARVVVGMPREGTQPGQRGYVEDDAPPAIVRLAHHLNGPRRHAGGAKEERLHLLVRLLLGCRLGVAREGVPGIVNDDVDVELAAAALIAEVICRGGEGGADRAWGSHIERELEDVGVAIREVGEVCRVAGRGDQALGGLTSDERRNGATDAGRAARDCWVAGGFSVSSY